MMPKMVRCHHRTTTHNGALERLVTSPSMPRTVCSNCIAAAQQTGHPGVTSRYQISTWVWSNNLAALNGTVVPKLSSCLLPVQGRDTARHAAADTYGHALRR